MKTNFIFGVAGFIAGTVTGVIASKIIIKKRFDNDLEEVRTYYRSKNKKEDVEEVQEVKPAEEHSNFQKSSINLDLYEKNIKKNKYTSKEKIEKGPVVITPDNYYDAETEYDSIELCYYTQDEILSNNDDENLTDQMDILLGKNNIDRAGEFEADALYIRHPKKGNSVGTQYRVQIIDGSYEELTGMVVDYIEE